MTVDTPSSSASAAGVRPWLLLLLVSLVCISAGLYNGFPLVTSDTGTYLNSALHFDVPNDRPITYSLFARFTGWRFSHWLIIWAQGLLLGGLLLRCLHEFVPAVRHPLARLVLVGALAWATGFSWYCSQLMPDIFTAIGLITLALLVLGRFKSWRGQLGLVALLLLSEMVHNSNLLTFSLTALGFGVVAWQQRLFGRGLVQRAHWRVATAAVLAGWVLLPGLHAAFGGGFVVSRATPVFLLARLVEGGIVDKYLAHHCDVANPPRLCASRDNLPNDAISFLWDEKSPYNQSGGLEANLADYRAVVKDILLTPRYYPYLATLAVQSTLRQLTHVAHGDGLTTAYRENTNPYWKVNEFASYELKSYLSSLQNHNALDFKDLNQRTNAAQLLALLVVAWAIRAQQRRTAAATAATTATAAHRHELAPLLLLLTLWGFGLVANAFATGALANVLDRLQGRVAWLLPFWALLLVASQAPAWVRAGRSAIGLRTPKNGAAA